MTDELATSHVACSGCAPPQHHASERGERSYASVLAASESRGARRSIMGRTDETKMTVLLPASFEEAAPMQCAREMLRAARGAFEDGDPFAASVASTAVRQMLKAIADSNERNAAHIVRLAAVGSEDARQALADLVSERNERREALGSALTTYVNMLSHGPPPHREPRGAPVSNFLANFVIVMMLLGLKHQFPLLRLRRSQEGRPGRARRPSACSIVAAVLKEAHPSPKRRGRSGSIKGRQFAAAHGRPPASNDEIEDWVCRMTAGCDFRRSRGDRGR
jgi:hypothetical protein